MSFANVARHYWRNHYSREDGVSVRDECAMLSTLNWPKKTGPSGEAK
jgi:hypothetical protein